jgi:hypothetical protein
VDEAFRSASRDGTVEKDLQADFKLLSSIEARFPYEPNVEASQKEHEVEDAPQPQQFWRNENGKPKKKNGQVSLSCIEIRAYPRANKKCTGEKFADLFPTNTHRHSPNEPETFSTCLLWGQSRS